MSYTHKKKKPFSKAEDRERRAEQAKHLLAQADEVEDADGRRILKLPDQKPPKGRSQKTRYHYGDVGKEGNIDR